MTADKDSSLFYTGNPSVSTRVCYFTYILQLLNQQAALQPTITPDSSFNAISDLICVISVVSGARETLPFVIP